MLRSFAHLTIAVLGALWISQPSLTPAAETALALMDKAHHGRATWQNFPGFSAEITASAAGESTKGTLDVSADGQLDIKLAEDAKLPWVERALSSLIGHRLADDQGAVNVAFADEDMKHPFGRLLKSNDGADKSLWRVQGDVLTEVHRFHGDNHLIISVGEVARTPEGKHLPRSYSVTTWNKAGAIVSTRQVLQEWKRVSGLDVPTRILAATNKSDGTRSVEEIVLSAHRVHTAAGDSKITTTELPSLKVGVTSAGAAIAAGNVYLYGGHTGSAHTYSADLQSGSLVRLNLAHPEKWEEVSTGPKRTGLAMVGHNGKIYRIGGWESKNETGEKWVLHSQRDFSCFDPATGKWTDLTSLPRGRSSHDAALVGDQLYVVGGWEMKGEGDGDWHTTALVCDLSQSKLEWKEIAPPPFRRRALAVAGYAGKLYVLGGMTDSNEVTSAVAIYDPKSNQWTEAPALPGKGMDTFGLSAFGGQQGLFATMAEGSLLRLSDDGKSWEKVGDLKHPRFFHRLVMADDGQLIVVAGTTRGGKVLPSEAIRYGIAPTAKTAAK